MNQADQAFLETLGWDFSPSSGEDGNWRIFSRNGSVLLILPDRARDFQVGLSLYYPQRKLARILVQILRRVPAFRRFLKPFALGFTSGGPLDCLRRETGARPMALLLGNPKQQERRALLLLRDGKGKKTVAKLGTTPEGCRKIAREASLLTSINREGRTDPGIPAIERVWEEDAWQAFTLNFFENTPGVPLSRTEIVAILQQWASGEKSSVFRDCSSWREVSGKLTDTEAEIAARLELRSSLRHGDFAPWNVLRTPEGNPMVIDWEFGREKDVPGWDLIHYLILEADLIERRDPENSLKNILELLRQRDDLRGFLEFTGWLGHEKLLVRTYLLSMGDQLPQFASFLDKPFLTSP